MRFAVQALRERGVDAERHLRLDGAQHEVRRRPIAGTASSGPTFVCRDGPVLRYVGHRALLRHPGGVMAAAQARSSPSGSSPPATAASSACSTARTSCSPSPSEIEIAYFLEATRADCRGPVRPLAGRGLDHHRRRTPSGSSEVRRLSQRLVTIGACATAGGIQALRNFADVEEFVSGRLRDARLHLDAGDLDPDRGPRPGRLRAARLPDQQAPAARGDQRLPAERRPERSPPTASASSASGAATSA